jgi:splicing factor 1
VSQRPRNPVQVVLPPHLTGRKMSDDPAVQRTYEELWRIEGCVRDNKIDMPPEGERSPSPPPIYDRFGIRQNTREVRYKERMLDRRADLIEELIKVDPKYQPPSDYRPRKRHRKIMIPYKEYPGYNFIGTLLALPAAAATALAAYTCRLR